MDLDRKLLIAKAKCFPLSEVAWRVLRLTSDLEVGSRDLEEVILRDSALTARVLTCANSAQFGMAGTVTSVRRAAAVLGNRRLRSLVVTLCLEGIYNHTAFGRALWSHSLTVGLACRELASLCRVKDPEEALVAGLLHDVGKIVLDQTLGIRYAEILDRPETALPSIDLERERLGTDHAEIGADLADRWGLPARLEDVIRWHHDPARAGVDPNLCGLVALAQTACRELGIGEGLGMSLEGASETDLGSFANPEAIRQACEPVREQLDAEREYFGVPPRPGMPPACRPDHGPAQSAN